MNRSISPLFACLLLNGLVAASSPAAAAPGGGVKLQVGGTISNHLPRPHDDQRLLADYPAVGSVRLTTNQYCGDGDVSRLAGSNPGLDFVSNGPVAFVYGYWAVPAGAGSQIPTDANWFPIGTGVLPSGNGSTEEFTAIGRQGATKKIITLVNESIAGLSAAPGYRMPAATAASTFQLYQAILMCKAIQNASGTSQAILPAHAVAKAFQTAALPAFDAALQTAPSISAVQTFTLAADADGINFTVGSGASTLVGDPFYDLAAAVNALAFPTAATDITSYQQALAGTTWNKLATLHAQYYSKGSCTSADITGVTPGTYPWEAFPLQLTCLALSSYNGNTLDALVKGFLMPAVLPTEAQFLAARLELTKLLARAALMQQNQIAFSKTWARPKDSCFVSSQPYINKVMGSQPINVVTGKTSNSATMKHPEGNLAMGAIGKYQGANGNANTIFGMSSDSFQPLTLTQGQPLTTDSVFTKSYLLRFNVRGIGCAGVVYCMNEGGQIPQ